MRQFIIMSALLLAGCNDAGQWENEQSELGNDLNGVAPAVEPSNNILADTDYIDENSTAANDVDAMSPTVNETAPPPPPQQ